MRFKAILAAAALCATLVIACLGAESQNVETNLATLRIAPETGDLVGLTWKNPKVDVIQESRLGESFRILLPRQIGRASCRERV